MKQIYKDAIKTTLDIAKEKGADACDLILDSGTSFTVKTEDGEISEYKVSGSEVLGIRVIKDQRIGTSYVETFDNDSLNTMVINALNGASYSKQAPHETIELKRDELFDGTCSEHISADEVDPQEMIDLALKLEKDVKSLDDAAKTPPYNGAGQYKSQRIYANSLGTICKESTQMYQCYTSALLDEDQKQSMHFHSNMAYKLKDLDADLCVKKSVEQARGLLDGSAIETGKYSVVFDNNVLDNIFGAFSCMFSAKAALENLNPLKDKKGEKIGSALLTIIDRPHLKEGFSYTAFDGEGNKTQDLTLIENGVLTNFFHNSSTAKELGQKNTFNATRSPKSPLSVGGTHTWINPGSTNNEEMMNGLVFEIVSVQGIHSGADSISGDFSFAASGYLKEDNKIIQSVKNVTISGNFYSMIGNISLIGNEVIANSSGNFFAPKIRFEELSVAGK